MGASVRLGKILGIPVSLHFSWFIIFLLFTIIFEGHFDQRYHSWSTGERWLIALATSLLLFISVLAHELSHSLMAIRRGIPVKGITLFIFGGVSQIAREAQRPSTEFIVAIVGPFASIILGFVFLGLAIGLEDVSEHLSAMAEMLAYVNIGLGVFNMLPGFPLDGGRVLRAAAWWITRNYWRATNLATLGGQAVALVMIAIGITLVILDRSNLMQGVWLVIMGIFLQTAASASRRQFRIRENLRNYTVRDVMMGEKSCSVAPRDITLSQLMEDYITPSGSDFFVLTWGGRAQGVITRRLIERVPQNKWPETWASSVMVPLAQHSPITVVVGPEEDAYNVMELMEGEDVERVLVIEDGVLLGLIAHDGMRRFSGTHAQSRA